MELKTINWSDKSFVANGRTYHLYNKMSIARSAYAEEAKIEMETGLRVGGVFEMLKEVFELLNQQKIADASVHVYNSLRSIETFFDRPAPILRLCACFLNYEGEDIREIDDALVTAKINDWKEEGISMESFFLLGLTFLKEETTDLLNMQKAIKELSEKAIDLIKEGALNTPISE